MTRRVKVTYFNGYGYVIDLPDGRERIAVDLPEANLIIARDATGLQVHWSDRAQKQRMADLKAVR